MKALKLKVFRKAATLRLVIDLFAGGGGARVGIEAALRRSVDIALNLSMAA